jgi:DNA-binding transcriptional MocR family regulator
MTNRHRKDLGRNRPQRFVQIFHWEMDCAAYKDLSANARAIYDQIKRRYNGSNNGFITYSVREAARELKIGNSTAKRAFDQLQDHGFIVAEQRGHFHWKINPNGSKIRPASEWRLTIYDDNRTADVRCQAASKEFMRWPQIQNAVPPQTRMVSNTAPHVATTDTMITKTDGNGAYSGNIRGVRTE